MSRVIGISGPSTIVVERDGVRSTVQLSGIEVTDAHNAEALLRWSIASSWVMVEDGQVYRSPDGMLVNAELVKKGYAHFTGADPSPHTPVVYLGELDLGKRPAQSAAKVKAPVRRVQPVRRLPVRWRPRPSRTAPVPRR